MVYQLFACLHFGFEYYVGSRRPGTIQLEYKRSKPQKVIFIFESVEFKLNNFSKILNKFDYFFTAVFTVELLLKIIAYGLVVHPGAFCRDPANVLDMFVVIISLISIFVPIIM